MQTQAQRPQATFDAGCAADLPVTLHPDKVTIRVAKDVEITFDPLSTANFADLIKQRLGMLVVNSSTGCYSTSGDVRVDCKGKQLVHEYKNKAPWQADCEAIVRMGALLWNAKQNRGE